MLNAKGLFDNSLDKTATTMAIYDHLSSIHAPMDYSDLLRWQWVEAVSALDRLIHDYVRIGMLEIFRGTRTATDKYKNEPIPLSLLNSIDSSCGSASRELAFESFIVQKLSYKSFQEPAKLVDGLSYIWLEQDKWKAIANAMGRDTQLVKTELNNIVLRRNQIVHESDCASISMGKQAITRQDAVDVVQFIRDVGNAIDSLIK